MGDSVGVVVGVVVGATVVTVGFPVGAVVGTFVVSVGEYEGESVIVVGVLEGLAVGLTVVGLTDGVVDGAFELEVGLFVGFNVHRLWCVTVQSAASPFSHGLHSTQSELILPLFLRKSVWTVEMVTLVCSLVTLYS